MLQRLFVTVLAVCASVSLGARGSSIETKSTDEVIQAYVQAVGGMAAVDRIETRQVIAKRHHGAKLDYFWQRPNKVLLIDGKKKLGYDGGSGWMLSQKKRVTKLSKGSELPLEMDANPLRYVHMKQLYPDIQASRAEVLDGEKMDVLRAPNDLGSTKLYFDEKTHLLVRVEDRGEMSAYFVHSADFSDYREVDGLKLPFRIAHTSTEPGGGEEDLRVSKIMQNIPLKTDIFRKPASGSVVLGGKR